MPAELVVVLSMYLLFAAHEIGHLIGLRIVGVQIEELGVGFIGILHLKIRGLKVSIGLLPLGGFVTPVQKGYDKLSPSRKVVCYLFGPLASVATGFFCLALSGMGLVPALVQSIKVPLLVPSILLSNLSFLVVTPDTTTLKGISELAGMFRDNPNEILQIVGLFSLVLAGFNMLPIPPLDGGLVLFEILEKYFGRHKVQFFIYNGKRASVVFLVKLLLQLLALMYVLYLAISEVVFAFK